MKIVHIINSLKKGGAEGNLYRLCKFHKKKYKDKVKIIIITLINNGFYESELKKIGISIYSLNFNEDNKSLDIIKKILKFRKLIKNQSPDIIQSWMYHANFLTLFIQKKFYDKLFWNIRHSELNLKISKKLTIFLSIICGIFSKLIPKKIIYCSERSINFHENEHFYDKNKSILIYNGCNEKNYYPSKYLRSSFKKKNKIKKTDIILGYAGRYAKQKNIPSLLYAFSKLKKNYDNIYLYMVGKNINFKNKELVKHIKNLKIKNRLFLLNEQKSLLKFYNGIDLLILPSLSESFPNVIPESMLCSTPVLSTNAGCSKTIIGKYGFIIAKNSKQTISSKLDKVIKYYVYKKKEWALLKKNSRIQIKKNFSISNMADKYVQHWIS